MLEHSLLDEGVFRVVGADDAHECLTLPQVLARLSVGEDLAFTALRPHQRAPWHAFLVQLAYLALEGEDSPKPPLTPAAWVARLRGLTSSHPDDGPWCLINTDWQQPAFLQAPCSAGHVADFVRTFDAAQDIDVLVTARHHDEKSGKLLLQADTLDNLVYAMVALQGMTPGLGRGNHNSMRVNGYYGSRSQFRLAFARGSGSEFIRDLTVLLEVRGELADRFAERHPQADLTSLYRLLWLQPWDEGALPISAVHPLCLEVCRRVRLVREEGKLMLRRAGSKAMRVAAKDLHGDVMDPWIPVVCGDVPKAFTAQSHSLGYRSLQALLFDDSKFRKPLLARPSEAERRANQPGTWIAQVLVSGDGGTDGLLMRELHVPAPVLTQMKSAPAAMALRSQQFVNLAGLASGKVVRSAFLQFVDGSDDVDWKNRDFERVVKPWVDRYEQAIDEAFFVQLFDTIARDLDDNNAQQQWVAWLAQAARIQLSVAALALPTRDNSRQFARARAERFLHLSLRKHFGTWLPSVTVLPVAADTDAEPEDAPHG